METAMLEPIRLEEAADLPVEAVGGKAARLATLHAKGFAVPDGFVLTTAVHQRALGEAGQDRGSIARFPEEIRPGFVAACERLGYPLIVRSSAVAEDLETASFAGQFESVLHVGSAPAAIAAVEHCWRAAGSAHLTEYRRARQADEGSVALLVQRQLEPTSAGVAFGRDPVTGENRVVIEAVPGLADRLLDGEVSPERWVVTEENATSQIPEAEATVLAASQAVRIAGLVNELGEIFDGPQDVEWAFVRAELFALQSRPITTLSSSALSRPRAVERMRASVPPEWLRDNMHWPDRLSPLGVAVWNPAVRSGITKACDVFGLLIGSADMHMVDHRVYLEVIPFGGRPKLPPPPPWLLPVLIRVIPRLRKRIGRSVEAVRNDVAGEVLERWIAKDAPWLASEIARRRAIDLHSLNLEKLTDQLDETVAFLDRSLTDHYVAIFGLSQALAEYVFLARDLLGWDTTRAMASLAARSTASTDAAVALEELARRLVVNDDHTGHAASEHVSSTLTGTPHAGAELRQYLDRFGGRMLGLDPMAPTIAEAPEALEPALEAAILRVGDDAKKNASAQGPDSNAAADTLDPVTLGVPDTQRSRWERAAFRAACYYGIRDESELLGFGEPLGLVRRIALELGRRLAAEGLLERPEHCFMLTPGELRQAAGGDRRLHRVAAIRQREFDAAALIPDPPEAGTLPPPPDLRALPAEARFANEALGWFLGSIFGDGRREMPAGAVLSGTPASGGRYRGPVRVIRGAEDFHRVRQGDVLVCPTTAPTWSPILGQVGAVVADSGGMLSHPAIIAREFRIPAIVGTVDGTRNLRDGQMVIVDGDAGTVSLSIGLSS